VALRPSGRLCHLLADHQRYDSTHAEALLAAVHGACSWCKVWRSVYLAVATDAFLWHFLCCTKCVDCMHTPTPCGGHGRLHGWKILYCYAQSCAFAYFAWFMLAPSIGQSYRRLAWHAVCKLLFGGVCCRQQHAQLVLFRWLAADEVQAVACLMSSAVVTLCIGSRRVTALQLGVGSS
jgi:hypothetical protein